MTENLKITLRRLLSLTQDDKKGSPIGGASSVILSVARQGVAEESPSYRFHSIEGILRLHSALLHSAQDDSDKASPCGRHCLLFWRKNNAF